MYEVIALVSLARGQDVHESQIMSPFSMYADLFFLPILATIAYFLLYYIFILVHLKVKQDVKNEKVREATSELADELLTHARNMPGVATDVRFIRADRTVLNMLEQMPPFIIGMSLLSIFVNPDLGGYLGFSYIFLRIFYYPLYYRGAMLSVLVTYPNYAIVLAFYAVTALKLFKFI